MGYKCLRECINDLERTGQLRRIEVEIDANLEAAEIQRRVYQAHGPALLFSRVKGCAFPIVCNLFGTMDRARFLFRDSLDSVHRLVELKAEPTAVWKNPWRFRGVIPSLWRLRPKFVRSAPVLDSATSVSNLPQQVSWPADGGAFITLPLVYTEDADAPGWRRSNLGMYRVQLSGNEYLQDREVGLHYQIHRGIGVHHSAAIRRSVPFRVSIAVGGPPALILAAVMPLPEGFPELAFAGALGGRRVRMVQHGGYSILGDADFVITGTVDADHLKPEGPFGDHLGYYSLTHPFPVLRVDSVLHRRDAIWPMTVVGRPPQEDTTFGKLIHEMTGPIIPTVVPGLHAIHAVDASGVHPLLLAIGSERYVPYAKARQPQELLTTANAILGQGQLSLAKYLFIVAREDDPGLDVQDIPKFFRHLLERVDFSRDLHFQTRTTIDTLDYSGEGLNAGSKLVIAAAGPKRRELARELPGNFKLPPGFTQPRLCIPGVIAIQGDGTIGQLDTLPANHPVRQLALILVVDDSEFAARHQNNWLWVTFTRSNPATDVYGVGSMVEAKHWSCIGPLIIDARIKAHHAPPLIEDPDVRRRVDQLGARGGPLHGII